LFDELFSGMIVLIPEDDLIDTELKMKNNGAIQAHNMNRK
jgi:hypothetical protein